MPPAGRLHFPGNGPLGLCICRGAAAPSPKRALNEHHCEFQQPLRLHAWYLRLRSASSVPASGPAAMMLPSQPLREASFRGLHTIVRSFPSEASASFFTFRSSSSLSSSLPPTPAVNQAPSGSPHGKMLPIMSSGGLDSRLSPRHHRSISGRSSKHPWPGNSCYA